MALFRHKLTGVIVSRPAHYAEHKILGKNLELISVEETESAPVVASPKKRPAKKTTDYKSFAKDGDDDGLVQDTTEWERPVGVEIPQEETTPDNEEN